ncbi:hypothetical protein [Azorhizobium doebereinerae]|nr:hypothetical protein [Azorhizobium doebereinerae]
MRPTFIPCASRSTAKRHAPWAVVITRADGGFLAFDSVTTHATWRRQK